MSKIGQKMTKILSEFLHIYSTANDPENGLQMIP